MEITFTKQQIIESKTEIDESFIENALLIAGFVPVIGEIADIILIIKFLKEDRYIEAGLMLFALIPTVGDIAVKPFLAIGRKLGIFKNAGKFAAALAKNPKLRLMYEKIFPYMKSPQVEKLVAQIGKVSPAAASKMKVAKDFHITNGGKIVMGTQKTILGKTKTGLGYKMQQKARAGALEKYLVKTGGVEATKFLPRWWNVVYKGSRARKAFIHKVILGSNLLGSLGIYNIEDLERKMSDPVEADKLAKDPKFASFYNQVTTEKDVQQASEQQSSGSSGIGSVLGGVMSMNMLKSLALKLIP